MSKSAEAAVAQMRARTGIENPVVWVSDFQERCIEVLSDATTSVSTADLAVRLNTSRVAIVSAMRSLERKGLAGSHRWPNDQWAALYWFIRR
ncbi:HTH domain-containing protein [Burkholderia sp. IDO3]|uniref:HTH domain-containing protein n=1 Tax=Burkholderia sp. IDO3 TaxID=1705310 RepID=UPI000BBB07D5|nr:HTH domain-containing protein [Burkholderia sp. IDO3]